MSIFIIAEAGVNHNGSLTLAKKLVDVAVESGADAVKFQTFKTENLVTETVKQAAYQVTNTGKDEGQFAMLKRLELSESDHRVLVKYCLDKKIEFMSTPFDDDSIHLLRALNMKKWKIPSGELLSIPYLRKIAKFNCTTILSTGMGNLEEVDLAITTLLNAGLDKNKLTVLQANSAYPTPYHDVNLRAMLTLKETFNVDIGLSDHSLGIEVPIAAVAMGASVIEKHFTLDKSMPGPDHKASLSPSELSAMVTSIRHVEQALGSTQKVTSESEASTVSVARKRIVAKKNIVMGDVFSDQNLTIKRGNEGVFSRHWDEVVGQVSKQAIPKEGAITNDNADFLEIKL